MAQVIITFKIMPSSPEADLQKIESEAKKKIEAFGGHIGKVEQQPIAFGLKALNIIFIMDEKLGSTEKLEEDISKINNVESVQVVDVRRAIG